MTREELEHELSELREEEFRLRLRRPTEELPNALRLRSIRRDIARIQTLLREDKLGLIQLPKKSQKEIKKEEAKPEKKEVKEKETKKKPKKKTPAKKKLSAKSKTSSAKKKASTRSSSSKGKTSKEKKK
jgi:large subunit ribosomal protein L29